MMRLSPKISIAVLTGLFLAMSPAASYAHADLVETVPAEGEAATTAPEELRLVFSDDIELAFARVEITGPDETAIETGPLTHDGDDAKTIVVPVIGELTSGTYNVAWSVVASDGHRMDGSYTIEITP